MFKMLSVILFLVANVAQAQPNDFIILKKKDRTIRSYYAGTQIEFVTTNGVYKNALITRIANDSIFLQEFLVRRYQTSLGFNVTDTAGSFRYAYNYNEVAVIGKKEKGFNVKGSGGALFGGGILLTLGSGVVYLADRDKFSPALMITSAALAAIGYLLIRSSGKGMEIGKKHYRLEYIRVTAGK